VNYSFKHLGVKQRFHSMGLRERCHHLLENWCTISEIKMEVAATGEETVALFPHIITVSRLKTHGWNATNSVMLSCVRMLMFGNTIMWDVSGRELNQIILMTDFGSSDVSE